MAIVIAARFFTAPPDGGAHTQTVWTWIAVGRFTPHIAFYLDALSLVMMLVVTVVSFFIHLYSVEFMADDEGYGRFFAYMNLFVARCSSWCWPTTSCSFTSAGKAWACARTS